MPGLVESNVDDVLKPFAHSSSQHRSTKSNTEMLKSLARALGDDNGNGNGNENVTPKYNIALLQVFRDLIFRLVNNHTVHTNSIYGMLTHTVHAKRLEVIPKLLQI